MHDLTTLITKSRQLEALQSVRSQATKGYKFHFIVSCHLRPSSSKHITCYFRPASRKHHQPIKQTSRLHPLHHWTISTSQAVQTHHPPFLLSPCHPPKPVRAVGVTFPGKIEQISLLCLLHHLVFISSPIYDGSTSPRTSLTTRLSFQRTKPSIQISAVSSWKSTTQNTTKCPRSYWPK